MKLLRTPVVPYAQLFRNSLFNSCAWAITALINLVAIPIIIRRLGVEGYGLFVILTGLFGYFGMLDFGFSEGVIKYVAHHLELGNNDSVTRSINAALFVQMITGTVGVLVLCVFTRQIIQMLRVGPDLFNVASISLYVTAIGFFATMLTNAYNAVFKGLQRFDVLAKTTMGFSSLTSIIVVSILFLGGKLLSVVIATSVLSFVNLAVVLFLVYRLVPQYRLSLIVTREDLHALFGFGVYVFISRLASTLHTYFLQVVVAVILGPAAVTYVAVPMRLTSALESAFSSLVGVIFPYISTLTAFGDIDCLRELYSKVSKYVVALSIPVFLFVILFARQILTVWIGKSISDKAWPVLVLLACASLLTVWTMVPANTIFGTGNTRIGATFGVIVTVLNILFSVILIPRFGIRGGAVAVLIGQVQAPLFIWYVTTYVVGVRPIQYFERVYAFHILPATAFLLIGLTIPHLTNLMASVNSLFLLGLGGTLIVLYYSVLLKLRLVSLDDFGWSQ